MFLVFFLFLFYSFSGRACAAAASGFGAAALVTMLGPDAHGMQHLCSPAGAAQVHAGLGGVAESAQVRAAARAGPEEEHVEVGW